MPFSELPQTANQLRDTQPTVYVGCDIHGHISKKEESFIAIIHLFPWRNGGEDISKREMNEMYQASVKLTLVTITGGCLGWQHFEGNFACVSVLGDNKRVDFGFTS